MERDIILFGKNYKPFYSEKTEEGLEYNLYYIKDSATLLIENTFGSNLVCFSFTKAKQQQEFEQFREKYLEGKAYISNYILSENLFKKIEEAYTHRLNTIYQSND